MDKRSFLGEFLGTFILVLFGCSSVACAVLFGEYSSIFQVGLVWGLGVSLAVYMTRYLSCAHLNPAVSVGGGSQADVILAEPVGSCADLSATILGPRRAGRGPCRQGSFRHPRLALSATRTPQSNLPFRSCRGLKSPFPILVEV